MWVLEHVVDQTTKNRQLVDAFLIQPILPVKTTNLNGNDIVTEVVFSTTPKQKDLLLQFQSLSVPAGLIVDQFDITGTITSTVALNAVKQISLYSAQQIDFTKSLSFSAYIAPFPIRGDFLGLIVGASKQTTGGPYWAYFTSYAVGSQNIKLTPKVTTIPVLNQNPPGRILSWSKPGFPVEIQTLYISKQMLNKNTRWDISIYGIKNTITLPTIPAGVTPILTAGTEYNVSIGGWLFEEKINNRVTETYSNDGTWIH